jgi:4-hydroxybenzoate polyprenyltransferase
LLREIVKDAQDIAGDTAAGYKTLPQLLGLKTTNLILIILTLGIISYLLYYINNYLINFDLYYASVYLLLTVIGPLIWLLIHFSKAQHTDDYKKLSQIIKIIIFFGMLSLAVTQWNISAV